MNEYVNRVLNNLKKQAVKEMNFPQMIGFRDQETFDYKT